MLQFGNDCAAAQQQDVWQPAMTPREDKEAHGGRTMKPLTVALRPKGLRIIPLALLGLLPACSSGSTASLVGEYSIEEGGQPELRITHDQREFFASVREGADQ